MLKILVVMLLAAASLTAGTASAQATGNTLARIKSAKAINVAYSPDSFPFSAANAGSDPSGYSIELCKRVITQIGRAVGEPAVALLRQHRRRCRQDLPATRRQLLARWAHGVLLGRRPESGSAVTQDTTGPTCDPRGAAYSSTYVEVLQV